MRFSTLITLITLIATCVVTSSLAVAPAHADDTETIRALTATMKRADVPSALGRMDAEGFQSQQRGMTSIIVCNPGKVLLQKGASRSYAASQTRGTKVGLTQTVYGFSSETKARKTWRKLNDKISGCTGTTEQSGMTTTLVNGKTPPRYDSGRARWVATTTKASGFSIVDHTLYFRSGSFIQTLDYTIEGRTNLTAKQLGAFEDLSVTLDERWVAYFGG